MGKESLSPNPYEEHKEAMEQPKRAKDELHEAETVDEENLTQTQEVANDSELSKEAYVNRKQREGVAEEAKDEKATYSDVEAVDSTTIEKNETEGAELVELLKEFNNSPNHAGAREALKQIHVKFENYDKFEGYSSDLKEQLKLLGEKWPQFKKIAREAQRIIKELEYCAQGWEEWKKNKEIQEAIQEIEETEKETGENKMIIAESILLNKLEEKGLGEFSNTEEANEDLGGELMTILKSPELDVDIDERAFLIGKVTALNISKEGWDGQKLKFREGETPEQAKFRRGAMWLQKLGNKLEKFEEIAAKEKDDYDTQEAQKRTIEASSLARAFLSEFKGVSEDNPIDIEETVSAILDWEILPPEPQPKDEFLPSEEKRSDFTERITAEDEKRIAHLRRLAEKLGGEVFKSKEAGIFQGSSDADEQGKENYYYALIITREDEFGNQVEDAVVDNPVVGNAAFVLRAENGNWREVFRHGKTKAVELGAERVVHDPRKNWEDEIQEKLGLQDNVSAA